VLAPQITTVPFSNGIILLLILSINQT